jgi:hypothetical protein
MHWYIWRVLTLSLSYFVDTVYSFFGVSIGKFLVVPSVIALCQLPTRPSLFFNNVLRSSIHALRAS